MTPSKGGHAQPWCVTVFSGCHFKLKGCVREVLICFSTRNPTVSRMQIDKTGFAALRENAAGFQTYHTPSYLVFPRRAQDTPRLRAQGHKQSGISRIFHQLLAVT